MPRTRIEIAELLVLHLVELNVKLDVLVVAIPMIDGDVMTWAMTHRSPVDWHFAQREQFARILNVSEVLHLKGNVMHLDLRAADEIHSVMVRVAAQEDEIVLDPVRNPEAQHATVKVSHRLRVLVEMRDMTYLQRAGAEHLVVGTQIAPFRKQLDRG